jgi:hypothetical protein
MEVSGELQALKGPVNVNNDSEFSSYLTGYILRLDDKDKQVNVV